MAESTRTHFDCREKTSELDVNVDVFFGDANPAQARIYARWRIADEVLHDGKALTLCGRLVGPECQFAHTLPARIPFVTSLAAGNLLAEAVVPDPCFWTPELPFFYRAELELRLGGDLVGTCERMIGIRRLGVRGRWLSFEGKRFVLRGVNGGSQIDEAASLARQTSTALMLSNPDDNVCEFASRQGVLLVADLTAMKVGIEAALRRLAQWPAVGVALLAADAAVPDDHRAIAPNLFLAQWIPGGVPWNIASWAQMAFAEATNAADFAREALRCEMPIVAVRRLPTIESLEHARAACDTLQRELVSNGDFAGYVV